MEREVLLRKTGHGSGQRMEELKGTHLRHAAKVGVFAVSLRGPF